MAILISVCMDFAPATSAAFGSTRKEAGEDVRMGAYRGSVIPSHDFEVLSEDGNGPSSKDETWMVRSPDKDREGVMGLEVLLLLSETSYEEFDWVEIQRMEIKHRSEMSKKTTVT